MNPRPYTPATRAADQARCDAEMKAVIIPERVWNRVRDAIGKEPTREQVLAWRPMSVKLPAPVENPGGTCDACGKEVERMVMVGQEYDYNSSFALRCRPCLVEALAALDGAP